MISMANTTAMCSAKWRLASATSAPAPSGSWRHGRGLVLHGQGLHGDPVLHQRHLGRRRVHLALHAGQFPVPPARCRRGCGSGAPSAPAAGSRSAARARCAASASTIGWSPGPRPPCRRCAPCRRQVLGVGFRLAAERPHPSRRLPANRARPTCPVLALGLGLRAAHLALQRPGAFARLLMALHQRPHLIGRQHHPDLVGQGELGQRRRRRDRISLGSCRLGNVTRARRGRRRISQVRRCPPRHCRRALNWRRRLTPCARGLRRRDPAALSAGFGTRTTQGPMLRPSGSKVSSSRFPHVEITPP